jgi:hypothetical protein
MWLVRPIRLNVRAGLAQTDGRRRLEISSISLVRLEQPFPAVHPLLQKRPYGVQDGKRGESD